MDSNPIQQTINSEATGIAVLQRDISYIRAAQDKQSQQLDSLQNKIDSSYTSHETMALKIKEATQPLVSDIDNMRSKIGQHDKIIATIGFTIVTTIIYAFMRLIIK